MPFDRCSSARLYAGEILLVLCAPAIGRFFGLRTEQHVQRISDRDR